MISNTSSKHVRNLKAIEIVVAITIVAVCSSSRQNSPKYVISSNRINYHNTSNHMGHNEDNNRHVGKAVITVMVLIRVIIVTVLSTVTVAI